MSLFVRWRRMDEFKGEEGPGSALLRRPIGSVVSGLPGVTGMELVA